MEVGLFNCGEKKNSTEKPALIFPSYSHPEFTDKWKAMGDSVAFPLEELPLSGKNARRERDGENSVI